MSRHRFWTCWTGKTNCLYLPVRLQEWGSCAGVFYKKKFLKKNIKIVLTNGGKMRIINIVVRTETTKCGCSSSGRAPPCQGGGSEFEPRHPLHVSSRENRLLFSFFVQRFQLIRKSCVSTSNVCALRINRIMEKHKKVEPDKRLLVRLRRVCGRKGVER